MCLLYTLKGQKDQLLHPVSKRLLAAGITPNMISAVGLSICIVSGIVAATSHLVMAVPIFLIGAFFDTIDGSLARSSGLDSEFGRYFDSTCDRLSEMVLVIGAVIGGVSSIAFFVIIGSLLLMGSRIINHRKGLNSDATTFGRPERVILLLAALIMPSPYSICLFIAAGSICIVSSGQALSIVMSHSNTRNTTPKIYEKLGRYKA